MDEQRNFFFKMESTSGEDAMKLIEMTTKDLEHYIILFDKAAAEFEGLTPILKEFLLCIKCYQTCYRELIHEKKTQ